MGLGLLVGKAYNGILMDRFSFGIPNLQSVGKKQPIAKSIDGLPDTLVPPFNIIRTNNITKESL